MGLGASRARGVLMHGPPGTGKTMIASALAAEAGINFLAVDLAEVDPHLFALMLCRVSCMCVSCVVYVQVCVVVR